MAIITKIEDQKNKKRFNIFVDDASFCGLVKETAILAGLKVGMDIDEQYLKDLILESDIKMAFEKASDLLATRIHSKKELKTKLYEKGYLKEAIDGAISKLEEYHYIDDEAFAKTFIETNKRYSRLMIENKLKQKGISQEIIDKYLFDGDDENEEQLCKKQIEKYSKGKDLQDANIRNKMIASLMRKGFSLSLIKSCIRQFSNDNYFYD